MSKYEAVALPKTKQEALDLAAEREAWSVEAAARDQHGSAREFMLTAMLLRYFAERLEPEAPDLEAKL